MLYVSYYLMLKSLQNRLNLIQIFRSKDIEIVVGRLLKSSKQGKKQRKKQMRDAREMHKGVKTEKTLLNNSHDY